LLLRLHGDMRQGAEAAQRLIIVGAVLSARGDRNDRAQVTGPAPLAGG
jgi:hypothetical protein